MNQKNITIDMEPQTLETLKSLALAITAPVRVLQPQNGNKVEMFSPEEVISANSGKYTFSAFGSITFATDDTLYVLPYAERWLAIIKKDGSLIQGSFEDPFKNGAYPILQKAIWNNLMEVARRTREFDFRNLCEMYSLKNGIGTLDENYLLEYCFEMPEEGVDVVHPYFQATDFPFIRDYNFSEKTSKLIGVYNVNNKICVFVHADGRTFATPRVEVVDVLQNMGYHKDDMLPVPFSNGEDVISWKWNHLCEELKQK